MKKFDSDKLRELRNSLPHGSQVKIAKALNTSRQVVHQALHGITFKPEVIELAINIVRKHNKELAEHQKRLEKVLNS